MPVEDAHLTHKCGRQRPAAELIHAPRSLRQRRREVGNSPSGVARRQNNLHAGVDIEGLGHRLVHLIDRKFAGDELFQRIGGPKFVQETQAAWVAGRGWLVMPKRRIWFASRCRCGLIGMSPTSANTLAAPARWRDYAARGDLPPVLAVMP
jgi:hypothetical protein